MDWIAVVLAAVFCVARALERLFLTRALQDDDPQDDSPGDKQAAQ